MQIINIKYLCKYLIFLFHHFQIVTVLQVGLLMDAGVMSFTLTLVTTELGLMRETPVKEDIIQVIMDN